MHMFFYFSSKRYTTTPSSTVLCCQVKCWAPPLGRGPFKGQNSWRQLRPTLRNPKIYMGVPFTFKTHPRLSELLLFIELLEFHKSNSCWLRHYPKDLGFKLAELIAQQPPVADLRNKQPVNPQMTDKEIFESMSLDDCWFDAKLPSLYWYLRSLRHLKIPETWETTIANFEEELKAVPSLKLVHMLYLSTCGHP